MSEYAVYAALITAFVGLFGLILNILHGDYSKRRARIWESRLARCDEQIGKLYAPLRNLVEQLDTTDDLKKVMVLQAPDHANEISKLIYDRYFEEIHKKIAVILETQMHLIEGKTIPESFNIYYAHVASEKVVFSIVDTINAAKASGALPDHTPNITACPIPYPEPQFKNDIVHGFNIVLARQERLLGLISRSDSYGRKLARARIWFRHLGKRATPQRASR